MHLSTCIHLMQYYESINIINKYVLVYLTLVFLTFQVTTKN